MPAKKLTPEHRAKLHALTTVHSEHVLAKSTLRAEIEEAYRDRLHGFELRESQLMNEAKIAGVPKTMIAAAVGTSNWAALEAKYALTASEFVGIDREPVEQWVFPEFEDAATSVIAGYDAYAVTLNWLEKDGEVSPGPWSVWVRWNKTDSFWNMMGPVESDPFKPIMEWYGLFSFYDFAKYVEDTLAVKWGTR